MVGLNNSFGRISSCFRFLRESDEKFFEPYSIDRDFIPVAAPCAARTTPAQTSPPVRPENRRPVRGCITVNGRRSLSKRRLQRLPFIPAYGAFGTIGPDLSEIREVAKERLENGEYTGQAKLPKNTLPRRGRAEPFSTPGLSGKNLPERPYAESLGPGFKRCRTQRCGQLWRACR